jgi:hypothetical protein
MNIDAVLEDLTRFGEADWLGLWLIAACVAEDLSVDDPEENLEVTLVLVKQLLGRGFRAGDSPAMNDGVHFAAWPDQSPDAVAAFIRRQWMRKRDLPSWGDGPWFAHPRFAKSLDA